jgi:hypothetical protein
MAKVHIRTIELKVTTNNGAQTVAVTAVNYYRTDAELAASNPFPLTATASESGTALGTAVASPYDVYLGELMPPPSRIRITATINA